jgi:hypothetical protein
MVRNGSLALAVVLLTNSVLSAASLEHIRVSDDGSHFVRATSGNRFVVWGVNYDHDETGLLLDEYWFDKWDTVVEDFHEIKALGANCVRIHLQIGKPLVIEEIFPLKCSTKELAEFIDKSSNHTDGWISFYWGKTPAQLRAKAKPSIGEAITTSWLDTFQQKSAEMKSLQSKR